MTSLTTYNEKSSQDYYPFGMGMPGRRNVSGYRYGFQGQEMDDEIKGEGNSVNYKYRMHDPRIGRFFTVDPLSAEYPFYSPYSFSGNRVIDAIELEGAQPKIVIATGNYSWLPQIVLDGGLNVRHTFIYANGNIWTYGRWAGGNKDKKHFRATDPTGPGVLVKITGGTAKKEIAEYIEKYHAKVYELTDVDEDEVDQYFQDLFDSSDEIPTEGPYAYDDRARIIDDYDLSNNNCTTKSCEAIRESNPNYDFLIWEMVPDFAEALKGDPLRFHMANDPYDVSKWIEAVRIEGSPKVKDVTSDFDELPILDSPPEYNKENKNQNPDYEPNQQRSNNTG